MRRRKEKYLTWIREHKKELVITGISVGATMLLYCGLKKRTLLEQEFKTLNNVVEDGIERLQFVDVKNDNLGAGVKNSLTRAPHDVCMHPRMLSGGKKPSDKALAYAEEVDFHLAPGQTLVKAYRTGEKVA